MGGCHGTWHVLHEGCRESPACYYAAMTGPIGLKLSMQVGTHKITRVRVSMVGATARAHVLVRFPYLGNGYIVCAQILSIVRSQLRR